MVASIAPAPAVVKAAVMPSIPTTGLVPAPAPTGALPSFSTAVQQTSNAVRAFSTPTSLVQNPLHGPCCFGQDSAGKIEVQELTPVAEQPAVPVLSIEEAEAKYNIKISRKAWYKAWQTWAVVGGVLALGGGGAYVVRRRKRVG